MEKLFNYENIITTMQTIKEGLNFPYINIRYSTLGGKENISIILCISKDNEKNWKYGIFENSKYGKLGIENNGIIKLYSGNIGKFRKYRAKNINTLIEKINKI